VLRRATPERVSAFSDGVFAVLIRHSSWTCDRQTSRPSWRSLRYGPPGTAMR